MASLEDTAVVISNFLTEHAGGPMPVPVTVQGMVDLFGGGKQGVSALARELAAVRGVKYSSARRNIERYTTERGTQKRTPKRLLGDLNAIAEQRVDVVNTERVMRFAERRGGVVIDFAGYVRISRDERYREFSVTLTPDDLRPFVAEAQQHAWYSAANELNYAVLQAWAGGSAITGHGGVITDVDAFDVGYGEG